jgi:glycosyltransferase involved in cell wall biosynthesis
MKQNAARVLVLAQHYRPEPNFITADVAEALRTDREIVVITAHPNYPHGKFYRGTRWWRIERSVENGVVVWRLPFFPDHSLSNFRRGLSFLSFALMATILAPFVAGRPQTVWVYHGVFTTGLAALWFKLVHRSRIVITCADLWPECFLATGVTKHRLVLALLFVYRRWINRQADLLICSTRGTMARYREEGIPAERMRYVPVWVEGITDELPLPLKPEPPNIVYAGNIGPAQQLDVLLLAVSELHQRGVAIALDIYGTGAAEAELRALAERLQCDAVRFHGRVPPALAFVRAAGAHAQYVALQPSALFRMTVPSKLAFSFAAGAPVLAGLEGEAAELAAESGGALAFAPGDRASLVAAIERLLQASPAERERMSNSLRTFYRQRFCRAALLQQYVQLLALTPVTEPAGQHTAEDLAA